MRNKIKQLMNKEEGFTLVELLAVIVILGIIVAIAIPSIGGIIDDADTKATTAENQLIEDAARLYDIELSSDDDDTNDWAVDGTKTVGDLVGAGYLDARENTTITDESTRTITKLDSGFKVAE